MDELSRRQLLALSGATAGSVAGCLDFGPLSGFSAKYDEWLPRPDTLPYTDRYAIRSLSPAAIEEATVLSPDVETRLADYTGAARELIGVSSESVESLFKLGYFGTIITGSFEPTDVVSSVTQAGWESLPAHEEFTRYRSPEADMALGITPSAVVISPGVDGNDQPFLDPVLDAKAGGVDRYLSADRTLRSLADALGNGDVIVARDDVRQPPIDNVRATGIAWRFTEGVAKTTIGLGFYSDDDVDMDAVDDLTETDVFADFQKVNTGRRGQVAIVIARVETVTETTMAPLPSIASAMETIPDASFDFTVSADGSAVYITHDGGEPIPRNRLYLRGSGLAPSTAVDMSTPGRWQGESSYDGTVVTGGDRVLVGIADGARIELVYEPIAESKPVTMASRTF